MASTGSRVSDRAGRRARHHELDRHVAGTIGVLLVLIFSKYSYLASLTSYYTFYLIDHFHVSVRSAQLLLFVFLGSVALGTVIGGPLGDRLAASTSSGCQSSGCFRSRWRSRTQASPGRAS